MPDLPTTAPAYEFSADPARIDPAHRGRGLGTAVVAGAVTDVDPDGRTRILLKASDDGRVVYERLGFIPLADPAPWLERPRGA